MRIDITNVDKTFHLPESRRTGLSGLFFSRTTALNVFNRLNFHLDSGDKCLLLGPNGSGKTTLLKLIAGLVFPDRGQVRINNASAGDFRADIGIMMGAEFLYTDLTGWENLNYYAHLYQIPDNKKRVADWANYWGLTEQLDRPMLRYSNGYKGRLALARATLNQPKLVLLDEPTVFLDDWAIKRLRHFLSETSATVLVTSHQSESIIDLFDRKLRFDEDNARWEEVILAR